MKHIYTNQRLRRFSLMFVLLIACASFVQAQDVWRGTTSSKWSVAANWSLGRVPLSTDDVVIGSSSITNQPTVDGSAVCKSLTVGGTYTSTLTVNYPITVSGNVIINSNGTVNHAASQTMTVKGNWTCSGNYYGQSTSTVTFAASGTQTMNGTNVDFKNLLVNAGSTILLNTNVNADVSVVCNGTWDPNEGTSTYLLSGSSAFSLGATGIAKVKAVDVTSNYMPYGGATLAVGSIVDYASTLVTQNIYSNFSYDNLKISGSGIKKLTGDYAGWNTSGVDVGNITVMSGCTLDLYSFSLSRGNTGGTLTVNDGATLRIGGTNSLPTFMNYVFGTNSTVEYYGSPQTITPASYGNLWITGTGTKTAGGALTVNDLSLNTATFIGGSYTHSIKSDWLMTSGVFTNTGTTLQFNGTGAQTISSTGAFNNLVINKTGGSTTLSSSIMVNGTLTFTSGNITTGANKVIIPSTGTVSRTSGHVVGNLQKYVSTGSNVSRTFEIGDASNYTPATTLFASVSVGGSLTASTTSADHASIASSTIDPALDVDRYWTLTNSGITFTTYSPTFTFVSGDVGSGASTSSFIVGRYNAGWTYPTVGTKTATTTQATGLNAFGDFQLGEAKQSFSISYAGTPFCNNASTGTVSLTGTSGGTYTSTAGLTINANTGTITPSTSTLGTYTVTYTRGSSSATTSVTITSVPSATISYSGPFCKSVATAQTVTLSGTTGGTYSASPAGLTISASTGAITPSTSTVGTYTVTYTVAAAGGCAMFTTTTNVTINAAPSATITYPGTPFCNSVSSAQTVTLTGTTGGTFSSTAGLTINASTGAITPSSSTAGTYTVTYTVAASGGCAAYTTTTTVTIVATPTAAISYAGPFCSSVGAAQHVTRTGTTGGTYSASPSGLTLNTGNGDITPSTSTPGTYTVTYSFASGGCSATATTTVTINAAPSATISYAAPFCSSASTAQAVTITGTTGGTFSSTAGLTINSSTGAITPSSSTPGTYTITYSVVASGGCSAYSTTASVTITAVPSATIAYANSSYPTTGGTISVVRTGTSGGTYSSTTGLSINTGNGDINLGASTSGTYTVTYTIAASGGCSAYTTTTSITVTEPYTKWTGATSTDWKTASNWYPAKVPDNKTDVIIPAGLSIYPVIPGNVNDANAEDLTIASGASLKLYGTLTLAGSISSNSGIVADSIGTIVMKGSVAQTISANAFANELFDLTIDNNAGVTLQGKLKLNDALTVKNGALTSNGNLILRSTAVRTARVAPITSKAATPVIGDVTVERYVAGRRKYRLMTSAVTTSTSTVLAAGQEARSIWGNWQNSGNNTTPGAGTIITGGTAATGFDTQTGSASLYTYNDITRKFVAYSSANGKNTKYTPLVAGVGYYMFVYGDRTNSVSTPTPNNTTLSETGTLVTGDQLYTTTTPIHLADTIGKYTLIGNPFASPINWSSVQKSGVDNVCWGWDPNLGSTGGYVTVNATLSGTILISPLSVKVKLDQYIQSGQAFFVRTTGKNPTITIQENDKVTNVNNLAFRTASTQKTANAVPLLAVNLLYTSAGSEVFADGAVAAFDNSFADTLGTEDALKIAGSAEAVSIDNSGQQLSIDARPKALNADTLNLNLAKLTKTQYTLQVFAQNMIGSSVQGYLVDRYLKTSKVLSLTDTNNVVFNIVPSDSASFDAHRFYISLVNLATLPVNYTAVLAMQEGKNVQVQWNVAAENNINTYQVEKSTNGVAFTVVSEVPANKLGGDDRYSWLDTAPVMGYNYYRIRAFGNAGASYLSKVVNLKISAGVANITVSPNPVKDQQINLQVSNIETGTYNTVLYDPQGREVYRTKLNYTGGFLYQALQPRMQLTPGMYYLRIFNERTKYDVRILME